MPPNLIGRLYMTMTKLYLSKQLLNAEILSFILFCNARINNGLGHKTQY